MRLIRPIGLLAVVLLLAALPAASTATGVQPGPGQCGPAGPPCPPGDSALIQIAKSAVPSVLPAGGGPVTYTYTVTNGGTVPLTVVTVSDDKCAPVVFVGGDTNANTALDVSETWTFSCTTTITTTTINVATAQGTDPSGSGTKASASVTVTVGCPPGTTNCVPPPCPSGTTDPNCPPPPCPSGTTGPNCPPPPPIKTTLVFECFDLRSSLDPRKVVLLTTKNFGNDTVLVRRATRMCEPALKTTTQPPAGTAQPQVLPNAELSLDLMDSAGGRHTIMFGGTMAQMRLPGGGTFDTEMLQMALESTSPLRMPSSMGSFFDSFFDVFVDLDMAHPSAGQANSFFDIFTEISLSPNSTFMVRESPTRRLMPAGALRYLFGPTGSYALAPNTSIPLLDLNGRPSGWTIVGGTLTPDPASPNKPVTRVLECFNLQGGKDVHALYGLRTANFGSDSVVVRTPDRLCEGALKSRAPIPAGTDLQPPPVVWECYKITSRKTPNPTRFFLNTRNFGVEPVSVLKAHSLCEEATKTIVNAAGTVGNSIGQPTGRVFECFSVEAKARQQPFFLWTRNFGLDKTVVGRASLMCERAEKRPLGTFTP